MTQWRDLVSLIGISRGSQPAMTPVSILGHNTAMGSASEETVWQESTAYAFPSSASTMTVSSDDANDTSAGTGCRTILVTGLDGDWAPQTEIVTMNGTSAVTTTSTWLRINYLTCLTTGSLNSNVGNIYIGTGAVTAGKPANVYNMVAATDGLSHSGFYSVAADHQFILARGSFGVGTGKEVDFFLDQYVGSLGGTFVRGPEYRVNGAPLGVNFLPSAAYPAKSDIIVNGVTTTGSTSDAKINLAGILENLAL